MPNRSGGLERASSSRISISRRRSSWSRVRFPRRESLSLLRIWRWRSPHSGRRVALVDLDLRRPSMARLFGVGSGRGITDIALREIDLDSALVRVPLRPTQGASRAEELERRASPRATESAASSCSARVPPRRARPSSWAAEWFTTSSTTSVDGWTTSSSTLLRCFRQRRSDHLEPRRRDARRRPPRQDQPVEPARARERARRDHRTEAGIRHHRLGSDRVLRNVRCTRGRRARSPLGPQEFSCSRRRAPDAGSSDRYGRRRRPALGLIAVVTPCSLTGRRLLDSVGTRSVDDAPEYRTSTVEDDS